MYDVTVCLKLRNRAAFQTKNSFLYISILQAYVTFLLQTSDGKPKEVWKVTVFFGVRGYSFRLLLR